MRAATLVFLVRESLLAQVRARHLAAVYVLGFGVAMFAVLCSDVE